MSDFTKILAENQKEMLKLIAPVGKKPVTLQNLENSDSEPENVFPNATSTPRKTKATTSKTTPVNRRNSILASGCFVSWFAVLTCKAVP